MTPIPLDVCVQGVPRGIHLVAHVVRIIRRGFGIFDHVGVRVVDEDVVQDPVNLRWTQWQII